VATRDGLKRGYTNNISAKGTSLHADLEPNVHTHSGNAVVRASLSESDDVAVDICVYGNMITDGTEGHCEDNTFVASPGTRTSKKFESAGKRAVSAILSPMVVKSDTSISAQHEDSRDRDSHRVKAGHVFNQQRVFSVKEKIFSLQTAENQYRPRNSAGRIKSAAPRTKPRPQWCPEGLTHTIKQRVQRLRALEVREEIAKKKRDELFNRDKPMVLKVTWREKCFEEKADNLVHI
jgi:hypothetical protein